MLSVVGGHARWAVGLAHTWVPRIMLSDPVDGYSFPAAASTCAVIYGNRIMFTKQVKGRMLSLAPPPVAPSTLSL